MLALLQTLSYLSLAQVLVLLFAIFATRLSEHRSNSFNNCMPELAYYSGMVSLSVFPAILAIIGVILLIVQLQTTKDPNLPDSPKDDNDYFIDLLVPTTTFLILTHIGLLATFYLSYCKILH